jgi:hypothetical protein
MHTGTICLTDPDNVRETGGIVSDEIASRTETFSVTLHLAGQQVDALRAIGKERGSFTDWEGRYTTINDLREMGLAYCVLGFWKLTALGRRAHKQLFDLEPA